MARCVAINVFGIDISAMLHKGLNNGQISPQTRNVQGSPEIVGPGVNLAAELHENINQWGMSLRCCQVHCCEAI